MKVPRGEGPESPAQVTNEFVTGFCAQDDGLLDGQLYEGSDASHHYGFSNRNSGAEKGAHYGEGRPCGCPCEAVPRYRIAGVEIELVNPADVHDGFFDGYERQQKIDCGWSLLQCVEQPACAHRWV